MRALTLAILLAVHVTLGLALCFAAIVVALAVRVVYETVMLPVRVWRAERDGASESWPEHLVAEDRDVPHHPV